ncbi:hypothetical protein SASPL_104192 [Salvia splendens]|uniref:Filament-like plant protein n=1 Tax=Salvia splendens TaxID=180675 RepID=A0A8X9A9K4_SALSN|nr:hypothetical protein SASPL_104192 [Salvia splendens]
MMEKWKWMWKRRPSERSPGESESSGSFSSPTERYSDEQDESRESPNSSVQSPEITYKLSFTNDEAKENVKRLTEKLSAALVNVSAKEELVKQHAKVAEEAVAGWEKAENEVAALKQHLEVALQQNVNLEREIASGSPKKLNSRSKLLNSRPEPKLQNTEILLLLTRSLLVLESMEKENLLLKQEMKARCKELESMIIERDLSIQAAETASKLQLESIKEVAKLEAECRRLQSLARKSSPLNNLIPAPTSHFYADSLTDSHSDSGERLNAVEMDACTTSDVGRNGSEPSCSDLLASALIAGLDQFKNEKLLPSRLTACTVEFDMMDDFLEMERLAALPDTKNSTPLTLCESASGESTSMDNRLLGAELDSTTQRVAELEKKLEEMEAERAELEAALDESQGSVRAAETKSEELQKELKAVNEAKELLESQLVGLEVEARTMSANVDFLNAEIQDKWTLSAELSTKCQELETESVLQKNSPNSNGELKIKQEDLAVAADKLAECQRTIASLGMQLKSLVMLEDFLIDTTNVPNGALLSSMPKTPSSDETSHSTTASSDVENGSSEESLALSTIHVTAAKSRNGFGKFFARSKSGVELRHRQD